MGILGARRGRFGRVTLFDIRDPVSAHVHPCLHLLFKVGGSNRGLRLGNRAVTLSDESCIVVPPLQRHADIPERCVASTVMLAMYLDTAYLEQRLGTGLSRRIPATRRVSVKVKTLIAGVVDGLMSSDDDGVLEESVVDLVGETALPPGTSNRKLEPGVVDFRIRRALLRLGADPHLHPNIEQIAGSVGLSRSRFFEQFKRSVGVAPTMYVDGLLLERAILELVESDRPIEEISTSLGFSAQSSFTRFFKDRVGFPPQAFRQAAGPPH